MSEEPIIKPKPAASSAADSAPASVDLDMAKPTGTTEVDDGMTFEVEVLAHEATTVLAERIRKALRDEVATGSRIVFLDGKLAAAVSLHRSFVWQCDALTRSFDSARGVAIKGIEWLAETRLGRLEEAQVLNLQPRPDRRPAAAPDAANADGDRQGVAEPATGTTRQQFASPGMLSGLNAAVNLLGYFGVDASYTGRAASVSERALVLEIARILKPEFTFSWPSLDYVLRDWEQDNPLYVQKLSRVSAAAQAARDRIQLLAELVHALGDDDARLAAAQRTLDQAHQLNDSSAAVLDQLQDGLFTETARFDMTPSELIQLGDRLITMARQQRDGRDAFFLTARIEKAGGSYRTRRHLWQALTQEPPLTFTGGCIVSYALLTHRGEFAASGTSSHQSGYRSHPRQWPNWAEDRPDAQRVRQRLGLALSVILALLAAMTYSLSKGTESLQLSSLAALAIGVAVALALAILLLGRERRQPPDSKPKASDEGDPPPPAGGQRTTEPAANKPEASAAPSAPFHPTNRQGSAAVQDQRSDFEPSSTKSSRETTVATKEEKIETVRKNLTQKNRKSLYQVEQFLDLDARKRISLRIPCPVFPQDPAVAAAKPKLGVQEIDVRWEPSIGDGPTSARVAVVDYNADTGVLIPPARWDAKAHCFLDAADKPITVDNIDTRQFDQVNVWAIVETVLEYFESSRGLGRKIPWGFDGNRLIVVPHAGYDANAYYDRHSKSLQLYYFGDPDQPKYTCLSHDIVAHETGHAVLDGIRPYYAFNSSVQTAAFHEFIGDLTAILIALRNNNVREIVGQAVAADLAKDQIIANLAEEFGRTVNDSREEAYLRTAHNDQTLETVDGLDEPHTVSEVLTGAMFDLMRTLAHTYSEQHSPAKALWYAINRFGCIAIQPLDLCPPVDIQFVDYARAVIRNLELVDPVDERGLRPAALEIFHARGLCPYVAADHDEDDCLLLMQSDLENLRQAIYHDVARLSASPTHAYHFLHDNRELLGIPGYQDFEVVDLYKTNKVNAAARRLPTEVVVAYVWREPVLLEGSRFGELEGETAPLLCGGTLVLDGRGNIQSWFRKPGTGYEEDEKALAEGHARRDALFEHLARQVARGRIGLAHKIEGLGVQGPPIVARNVAGFLSLESSPHFRARQGEERWHLSF